MRKVRSWKMARKKMPKMRRKKWSTLRHIHGSADLPSFCSISPPALCWWIPWSAFTNPGKDRLVTRLGCFGSFRWPESWCKNLWVSFFVSYHFQSQDWCGFKFPLFIAGTHMLFSWVATALSLHLTDESTGYMSTAERIEKVLPFTLFHAASLACANFALTYMYPSYHEALVAAGIFWKANFKKIHVNLGVDPGRLVPHLFAVRKWFSAWHLCLPCWPASSWTADATTAGHTWRWFRSAGEVPFVPSTKWTFRSLAAACPSLQWFSGPWKPSCKASGRTVVFKKNVQVPSCVE